MNILKNGKGLSAELTNNIIDNRLYEKVLDRRLYAKSDNYTETDSCNMPEPFLRDLDTSEELSDKLSRYLSDHYTVDRYKIICDVVKSRIPGTLHIEKFEGGEPVEFKSISKILSSLEKVAKIKIYASDDISEKIKGDLIKSYKILYAIGAGANK